jgi:hypothetical protein
MSLPTEPYDPAALNRLAPDIYTKLERMCEIAERARKKLERVKNADQHIACLLQARGALIKKCLDLEITAESVADMILEDAQDLPISRRKLIGAVNRCRMAPADAGISRRGRPRKNQDTGPDAVAPAPASPAETVITTTKTASAAVAPSVKLPVKSEKPAATTAAPILKDSPEREQRMRRKAPIWVGRYEDDPKYGPIVARHEGESDTDYFQRMWRTPPPWSDEMPRFADQLTQTQWVEKCWNLKSPEERAAHEASLPSTAR